MMKDSRFSVGSILAALTATLVLQSAVADFNVISKIAGTHSSSGFAGDGGQATAAKLNGPYGAILDTVGVMFISDYSNYRVRQVDSSGIITTIFGSSSSSVTGNDGAATAASGNPNHVQPDSNGNLYMADYSNKAFRKISGGMIYNFAGGGFGQTDGIAATSAYLSGGYDIAPDSAGNVYIPGSSSSMKKVVVSTGLIYTIAGVGVPPSTEGVGLNGDGGPATSAKINQPFNMFIDSVSRLYFSDLSGYSIRRIDLSTGIISFIAGGGAVGMYVGDGGPATSAGLDLNPAVTADTLGNLFISGALYGKVRKVDSSGIINRFAGGGSLSGSNIEGNAATDAKIGDVYSVHVKGDKLYFPAYTYSVVYTVSLSPSTYAPTALPSKVPSLSPSVVPTSLSVAPTQLPTLLPTSPPTCRPTVTPTVSYNPTIVPSMVPTVSTTAPSAVPSEHPTIAPSAGPSPVPSGVPSAAPSIEPSLGPSAVPTTRPTALPITAPSSKPTTVPSEVPTVVPTLVPSTVPSLAPSGVLTSLPTAIPTAPTKKPTALPSVRPTRQMISNSPTVGTTSAPTAAPTTHVDISFDANLYLFNTTDSALTSADASAVTTAVANTLNVTSGVSVANSGLVGSGRRLTAAGPPYNLWVLVNVHASTADHVGMNGSALFHHLKGALLAAEMSNELNSALAEAAHTYSAYGLYYVSDVNLTVAAYSVIPVAVDSTSDGDDKRLSRGDFAGVVIGILVSFMVLAACCYFAANSYASAVKCVDPQTDVEKA